MHPWTAASLLLLTCLLWCPLAASQPIREYTCDLTLVGCSNDRQCLQASLACQPHQPPLVVAYNSSIITQQQAEAFRGVKLSDSVRHAPVRLEDVFDHVNVWPLLTLEADDSAVLHLRSPVIRDVTLAANASSNSESHTCILLIARGTSKQTSVSITNGTFSGNQADVGVIFNINSSSSTVAGIPSHNTSLDQYWDPNASVTFIDSQVSNNTFSAGCFRGNMSHTVIKDSVFDDNTVPGDDQSLLYTFASHTTLDRVTFSRNTASGDDGTTIQVESSSISVGIYDCIFFRNKGQWGGAVVVDNVPFPLVPSYAMIQNAAGLSNAMLMGANQPTVRIQRTKFQFNQAVGDGGAIWVKTGNITILESTFEFNSAYNGGGISAGIDPNEDDVVSNSVHVTIVGCTFWGNRADISGGAIAADTGTTLRVLHSNFTSSSANIYGGAISAAGQNTTLQVNATNFTDNSASGYGGALAVDLNTLTEVNNSRFLGNRADSGGAIGTYVTPELVASTPQDPLAPPEPALPAAQVVYRSNYSLQINNAYFAANQASSGHGQDIHAGPAFDLELANCNITPQNGSVLRSNCGIGEYFDNTLGGCQNCPAYQYSLESHLNKPFDAVQCQPCPPNAVCPGGAVILPETGHWHGPNSACAVGAICKHTLANVTRCPNPSACQHNATSSALKALYPPAGNSSDPAMPTYLQHLCGDSNSPYTGLLCGQCNAVLFYGQTAPFTCHKCLTKGRKPETLDKPGISGLWFVYWFVFTGWLLFSTWSSLAASNKPSVLAERMTTGSPTTQQGRRMRTLDVWKAITVYKQYAQILLSLPVVWMPQPFVASVGEQPTTESFGQQALASFSESAASIDCMLAAYGLHWSAENRAVFKALFNALLVPLLLYVSVVMLQLLWFFVRQPLRQLRGWVGNLVHQCSRCTSETECTTAITGLFLRVVPAHQCCGQREGQGGCSWSFKACGGGVKAFRRFCCWLVCCGCCGGTATSEPGTEHSSTPGAPNGVATASDQEQAQQPGIMPSEPVGVARASTTPASSKQETLAAYMGKHAVVTFLSVVFQFYPSIARVGLGVFFCATLGESSPGDSVWVIDVNLVCPTSNLNSALHTLSLSIGILAVIFCGVWPVVVVFILVKDAHKQTPDGVPALQQHGNRIRTLFGFTYTDYRVDYSALLAAKSTWNGQRWWHVSWGVLGAAAVQHLILVWNAILDFQRFVLVIISFLVVLHEYYQVLILTMALVLYLVLLLWLRPFRVPAINRLQILSLVVLSMSCMLILLLVQPVGATSMNGLQVATIRWIIMAINIGYVLIAVLMLIRGVANDCSQPDGHRSSRDVKESSGRLETHTASAVCPVEGCQTRKGIQNARTSANKHYSHLNTPE